MQPNVDGRGPRARVIAALEAPSFLPACLAFATAVRLLMLTVQPLQQSSDFLWYFERATGIAAGAGYNESGVPTAFWPVGWPGALGVLFWLTGPSALAGQLANLVLSVLACLAVAVLGARLFQDRATGALAALLLAVYPNQIAYVPLLSAEIFYQIVLLGCVLLLLWERLGAAILAGLLFGVATLTKTQSLVLPAFLYLGVFLMAPGWAALRRSVPLACAVYVGLVLVVAPWTYRNWVVMHAVIPVSTNGGWTLMTGNNPEANGDYVPETVLAEGINHDPADQVAMDRLARERGMAWIKANPGRFLALMPLKVVRLWAPDGEAEWFYQRGFAHYDANASLFRAVRVLNQGYYVLLLALAVPSIWLVLRRRVADPWAVTGLALCLAFTLISLVFSGQSRFHFGLMPYVALYAAWTATRLLRRTPERGHTERLSSEPRGGGRLGRASGRAGAV